MSSEEKGTLQVGILQIESDKGNRNGRPFLLGPFTYKPVKNITPKINNYHLKYEIKKAGLKDPAFQF